MLNDQPSEGQNNAKMTEQYLKEYFSGTVLLTLNRFLPNENYRLPDFE